MTVGVAANAGSPLTNSVSVSGGGSVTATANDSTTIQTTSGLVNFNLNPSTIQTSAGGTYSPLCQNMATLDCVIFSGSISFPTNQDYFVSDIQVVMNPANPDGGAYVDGNDNYFQLNVPGTFGPDGISSGSYSGGLFEIDVGPNAPSGVYNGTATVEATDSSGDLISVSTPFAVDVS